MTSYIISLVSASLAVTLISILSPEGSGGGIAKHIRLLSALFLICVLIAPVGRLIGGIRDLANGDFMLPEIELPNKEDSNLQMQGALDDASKKYFLDSLTLMLLQEFSIQEGDLTCKAIWTERDGQTVPKKITVILSGSAIWKDANKIQAFVSDLLGCECITAIA